jgi:hypothetical protein
MNWPEFNDLWDYNDPAATEQCLRKLLADLERAGDADDCLLAMTR